MIRIFHLFVLVTCWSNVLGWLEKDKASLYEKSAYIVELTPQTFDRFTSHSSMVVFYAPWCPHCRHFAQPYMTLAEQYSNVSDIAFAAVNCVAQKTLCNNKSITGYPTIYHYSPIVEQVKPELLSGITGLKAFLNADLMSSAAAKSRVLDSSSSSSDRIHDAVMSLLYIAATTTQDPFVVSSYIEKYIAFLPSEYHSQLMLINPTSESDVLLQQISWRICGTSDDVHSGFTCGLWQLFHYTTVNAGHQHVSAIATRDLIVNTVKDLFPCETCRSHFLSAHGIETESVSPSCPYQYCAMTENDYGALQLWLWQFHNAVSIRVMEGSTRTVWPSVAECSSCWIGAVPSHISENLPQLPYNPTSVLSFLQQTYSTSRLRGASVSSSMADVDLLPVGLVIAVVVVAVLYRSRCNYQWFNRKYSKLNH